MGGVEHLLLPCMIGYLLFNIPPTLWEIYTYYLRGGLVIYDCHRDDTFMSHLTCYTDWWVYFKRFCDRPPGEASKAYFAWLDWSAPVWDKSIYIHRRQMAQSTGEYHKRRIWFYGPFRFNWWRAHSTPWNRGDDAASYKFPMWGDNGEQRARTEFAAAKDKCLDKYWFYHRKGMKQVAKDQQAKAAAQQTLEKAE